MVKSIATRVLALVALVAVAAASSPSARAYTNEPKRTLTIGITQFPSTFNPMIDAMLAKSYILAMTQRPITAYDKNWKLICLLCTELPTLENGLAKRVTLPDGKKGLEVTVKLHPKATWGDGKPVTTKDVIFAWKVGRHPKSGVANLEPFRRIVKITPKDDKTFVLTLDKVRFDYNELIPSPLPAHLESKPFADPAQYKFRTTFDADPGNPGLYYGPYRITKVVSGSHVVLEQNPTWYGKKPFFRRIVVRVITNTAALEANLLSGGIDYIAGELGLTLDQAVGFEKRHKDKYTFIYKAGLIYEHIDLNLDNPILKDRRVRRALIMGINRELLSKQLFKGRQPVAHSSVSPLDTVASAGIRKYPYDPKAAARLLDEAGWTEKRGGIRHSKDGKRLTLELMTTAGNRSRELVEQVLQSMWRRIGIDVRIRNQPARVFFGRTVTQRKYTGLAMYAWISAPESVPRTTLHSTQVPTAANNYSGQNYSGFSNTEMDGLLDGILVELDKAKRKPMWRRIQEIYVDELPVIPLYFRANPYILPKWLKGVEPTGHQYTSTLWVENWRAEP